MAHAGVGVVSQFGPVLFGLNDLRPTVLGCQATDSILPEMNHSHHYTVYEQASQFPNSLIPSAKLRSANVPDFMSLAMVFRVTGGLVAALHGLQFQLLCSIASYTCASRA